VVLCKASATREATSSALLTRLHAELLVTRLGLLLIFMIQNTERVRLDFLFWKFTWPLWLLTITSAVLGALVWLGLGVMRRHRRRKARRQAR
jgi:uncharacterized integral membrane protein